MSFCFLFLKAVHICDVTMIQLAVMRMNRRQYIHLLKTSDTTALVFHDTETRLLVWVHLETMLTEKTNVQ